jgi:hypothetical protein
MMVERCEQILAMLEHVICHEEVISIIVHAGERPAVIDDAWKDTIAVAGLGKSRPQGVHVALIQVVGMGIWGERYRGVQGTNFKTPAAQILPREYDPQVVVGVRGARDLPNMPVVVIP